jgi:hypothetical protein
MTHIAAVTAETRPSKAPLLPMAGEVYERRYLDMLNSSLRIYFNQVDNVIALLMRVAASQSSVVAYTAATVNMELTSGLALIDTTAGNVTVNLPDATTSVGYLFTVKRTTAGANTLTVQADSGNIDGVATALLPTQYDSLTFRSDGTDYWIT